MTLAFMTYTPFIEYNGKYVPYQLLKVGSKMRTRAHIEVLIEGYIYAKKDGKNHSAL
jgi:hypothetical protein